MKVNKAAVVRTLATANSIDGKGQVLAVVWAKHQSEDEANTHGLVVRQTTFGMDATEFRVLEGGKFVHYLQKTRAVLSARDLRSKINDDKGKKSQP